MIIIERYILKEFFCKNCGFGREPINCDNCHIMQVIDEIPDEEPAYTEYVEGS